MSWIFSSEKSLEDCIFESWWSIRDRIACRVFDDRDGVAYRQVSVTGVTGGIVDVVEIVTGLDCDTDARCLELNVYELKNVPGTAAHVAQVLRYTEVLGREFERLARDCSGITVSSYLIAPSFSDDALYLAPRAKVQAITVEFSAAEGLIFDNVTWDLVESIPDSPQSRLSAESQVQELIEGFKAAIPALVN